MTPRWATLFLVYAKNGAGSEFVYGGEGTFPDFRSVNGSHGKNRDARLHDRGNSSLTTVRLPVANRLGEEGDSVLHMMRNLEIERVTIGAMSYGYRRPLRRRYDPLCQ